MPALNCPHCGTRSFAGRHLVGQAIRCPWCANGFVVEALPFSFKDWLRSSHPAGLWLAGLLFAVAAVLVADGVWAAVQTGADEMHKAVQAPATIGTALMELYLAVGLALAGSALIVRWRLSPLRSQGP